MTGGIVLMVLGVVLIVVGIPALFLYRPSVGMVVTLLGSAIAVYGIVLHTEDTARAFAESCAESDGDVVLTDEDVSTSTVPGANPGASVSDETFTYECRVGDRVLDELTTSEEIPGARDEVR